jgi:hypothetical protein
MNQGEDTTPAKYYALSALTYLVAMVTSNKALTWVNYPTQVRKHYDFIHCKQLKNEDRI